MKSEAREGPDTLKFEYELDAPLAKVWRAVTIPEYVVQWLPHPAKDGESHEQEGATTAPSEPPSLRLVDCEPLRSVRYCWIDEDGPFLENLVTFRLSPNDSGGTTFSIIHERLVVHDAGPTTEAANRNTPRLLRAA